MKPIFIQISSPVFPTLKRQLIELALQRSRYVKQAAAWLGVGRETFYRWARQSNVDVTTTKDKTTFQSALRVVLNPLVKVPLCFWSSRHVRQVFLDAKAAYREKSNRYHPDHGGKEEDMIALNEAWERVERSFKRRGIE